MRISDGVQTCALPISPRCKKRIPRKVRTYAAFLVGSSERFEHLACLLELTTQLVDSRCSHVPCSDDDGLDSLDCGGLTQLADSSLDRIGCNRNRSEEHTSELQSLMRISYAGFCLTKKNKTRHKSTTKY